MGAKTAALNCRRSLPLFNNCKYKSSTAPFLGALAFTIQQGFCQEKFKSTGSSMERRAYSQHFRNYATKTGSMGDLENLKNLFFKCKHGHCQT